MPLVTVPGMVEHFPCLLAPLVPRFVPASGVWNFQTVTATAAAAATAAATAAARGKFKGLEGKQ
jgi:hypothetical protein